MSPRHDDAVEAIEGRCPRCGAARTPDQEYCIECGLRLPATKGAIPALRRRWVRRLGWYPGDWVWISILTLLVAAGGAAVAIALSNDTSSAAGTTVVVASPTTAPTTTAQLPTTPTTTRKTPTTTAPANPPGHTQWPASRNGWTIVLFSYPATSGTAAPASTAARAARAGLPEVGVLDSADFSSLHPGYYVVFSGVYSSSGEAEAALRSVRAAGFASAYTRQITR